MTIYDIKYAVSETLPHYFDRKTMKFFGQTLKSFKVSKCEDGRFFITAPIREVNNGVVGKVIGQTKRFFNPETNKLELN